MRKILLYTFLFNSLLIIAGIGKPVDLRCEYIIEPIGIDIPMPRFTWHVSSKSKFTQYKYKIDIATTKQLLSDNKADAWQSGFIDSKDNFAIYKGSSLKAHTIYFWRITLSNNEGKEIVSSISTFETAKMDENDWIANWISDDKNKDFKPSPIFRKSFEANKIIKKARLYISGVGYYVAFFNGKRVGENYLDPGYTHFDKRILYVTHDVTDLIQKGSNAIAVVLGNGWYNIQSKAIWLFENAKWRDRPKLICEIHVEYSNGDKEIVKTDPTWKVSAGGYQFNNLYSGDIFDANLEQVGWKLNSFNDSGWKNAIITNAPANKIEAQMMPPIQIVKEIKPVSMNKIDNNIYVFDIGQNISGFCRLKVKGNANTKIYIRYGELLKASGRLEQGNIDIYFKPIDKSETIQTDIFTLKGSKEKEVFMPEFTYHGFQYVEIESSQPVILEKSDLTAMFVHTNADRIGKFRCSNDLLNKIYDASLQSYLCNLHSIPTDCPQREKNGWTADAFIASDVAFLNFDVIKVYEKWITDFIDNQNEEGEISGIVPSSGWGYGGKYGPAWNAALFIIPDVIHTYYGDINGINNIYNSCKKYLDFLKQKENPEGLLTQGYGDWVTPNTKTPVDYVVSCYYYLDYLLMEKFSKILGYDSSSYSLKASLIKEQINMKYFNADSCIYSNGSQTAMAMALYLQLPSKSHEQKVADKLAENVKNNNYFLDFGIHGSRYVLEMLSKYGYAEYAYKMATKETPPSWGYWITKGQTTLAETWTLSPKFRDASLNHPSFGNVAAWMTKDLAGINYDRSSPGFKHFFIRPSYVKDLEWVEGEYKSIHGVIKSSWRKKGDIITLKVVIPSNTSATVFTDKNIEIGAGSHVFNFKIKY